MLSWAWRMVSTIGLVALSTTACMAGDDDEPVRTLAPLPTLAPTATPTAVPTTEPTPLDEAAVCEQREDANASLAAAVEAAMTDYPGTWGFALYDLECETMITANPDYLQYPASASKIIPAIAVLRAVENGVTSLAEVEPYLDQVMTWSSDFHADLLETYLTPEDLSAILTDSGTSEAAYVRETWHYTYMTTSDMALIWAALVRGELLSPELTELLMAKATLAEVPPEYETWPSPPIADLAGFDYGQKAGYWVGDGVPYHFVGAGFLRDIENPSNSFIPVVFMRADNPDLYDPQRRAIWPLVMNHIRAVRDIPETTTAGAP